MKNGRHGEIILNLKPASNSDSGDEEEDDDYSDFEFPPNMASKDVKKTSETERNKASGENDLPETCGQSLAVLDTEKDYDLLFCGFSAGNTSFAENKQRSQVHCRRQRL